MTRQTARQRLCQVGSTTKETNISHQLAPHAAATANLQPCRAAVAALIGTTIERCDFYIYDLAAAFVFGKTFFSRTLDPGIATLLSFVTLWAGFATRLVGGIIFGYLGGKIGRKTTLIIALIFMDVATMGTGLLPSYAQIGLRAPVGLVVLHVIQDVIVGGEWGGAVLIASESTLKCKSTLYSAFVQQGSPTDNLLIMLVFFALSALPTPQFMLWGWCVPFLSSALLVIVGMVVRLRLEELDDMKRVLAQKKTVKLPSKDVVHDHWGLVLLGTGTLSLIHVAYLESNFVLAWVTEELGYAQDTSLGTIVIALAVQFIMQPLGAWLVSHMDTRCVICPMVLPEFPLIPAVFFAIETKVVWVALLGMCPATVPHSMLYGAISDILACVFPMCVRYTGLSLAYQLYLLVVGGDTSVLMQRMLNSSGNTVGVAVSSALYALALLVCTLVLLNCTGYRVGELSTTEREDVMELGQDDADVPRPLAGPAGKPVVAVWVVGATASHTKRAVTQLPHPPYDDKTSHA